MGEVSASLSLSLLPPPTLFNFMHSWSCGFPSNPFHTLTQNRANSTTNERKKFMDKRDALF